MKNKKTLEIQSILFVIVAVVLMCGFGAADIQAAAKTPQVGGVKTAQVGDTKTPQVGAVSTSSVKVTKKEYTLNERVEKDTQVRVETKNSSRTYTIDHVKYLEEKTVITTTTTKYSGFEKTVTKEVETNLVQKRK